MSLGLEPDPYSILKDTYSFILYFGTNLKSQTILGHKKRELKKKF